MDIKGVCYDVGRVYGGRFLTRPVFDPVTTGRELQPSRACSPGTHGARRGEHAIGGAAPGTARGPARAPRLKQGAGGVARRTSRRVR